MHALVTAPSFRTPPHHRSLTLLFTSFFLLPKYARAQVEIDLLLNRIREREAELLRLYEIAAEPTPPARGTR